MKCRMNMRHWFAYRGYVGSSAPTCQHPGCDEPNPRYDADRDPFPVSSELLIRADDTEAGR